MEDGVIDEIPFLKELPPDTREIVTRLLLVLLTLAAVVVARIILTAIALRPLRRLTARTTTDIDDQALDAIVPAIRLILLAIALAICTQILGASRSVSLIVAHLTRSLVIIGIMLALYKLIDLFAPTGQRLFALTGLRIEDRLLPFFRTGVKLVIIVMALVILVQEWGYDVSGLIAGIGLGGLALSLAAQDTLANLFGFMAIVGDRPFDVGEYIVTPDVEGSIERVGLRSTQVRRLDQALISVPNNKLANSAILNWSRLSKRRVDYILRVAYDASSEDLRHLLVKIRDMLRQRPTVEPDSVVVYFIEFGDSALHILVRCYLKLADWGQFTAEKELINLDIMDLVNELGLSLAFPSSSIYIENLTDAFVGRDANPMQAELRETLLSPRQSALIRDEAHTQAAEELPPQTDENRHPGDEDDLPK